MSPIPAPSGSVDPNMVPTAPNSPLLDLIERVTSWAGQRPWLAAVAAAVLVLFVVAAAAARAGVWRWRNTRLTRHAQQVHILPPPEVDPAGVHAWWANVFELLSTSSRRRLLYGTPHVAMEYRWAGRELSIQVWVSGTVPAGSGAAAARAAWPGAACTVTDAAEPLPTQDVIAGGGALVPRLPAWYLLETEHDSDPMRALVRAGTGLHTTEHACVQILARPATPSGGILHPTAPNMSSTGDGVIWTPPTALGPVWPAVEYAPVQIRGGRRLTAQPQPPSAVTVNVHRVWSSGRLGAGSAPALLAFAADAGAFAAPPTPGSARQASPRHRLHLVRQATT